MRTEPDLAVAAETLSAGHPLFAVLAVAICLVAGLVAGMALMSGLLSVVG